MCVVSLRGEMLPALSKSLSRVGKDLYGGEVTTQNDLSHGQPDWAFMPLLDLNTPAKNVHYCITFRVVAIPHA